MGLLSFRRTTMGAGTQAQGKRNNKAHTISRRSGKSNWHKQKSKDAGLGGGSKLRRYNWGKKAIRRRTTGTGRMAQLRTVQRRLKNGFREGCKPKAVKARKQA